jgi:hypothetical protein
MKRIAVAIMACIGMSASAPEDASALEVSAGVKGGVSLATMIGRDAVPGGGWKDQFLFGFNGGPAAAVDFDNGFGVELDCIYTTKGINARESSGGGEMTKQYAYLDLPVLVRFAISYEDGDPLRQLFFAGPCFSFLQSARETTAGTGPGSDSAADRRSGMKPRDFGIIVGFAGEIEAGPGRCVVDIRYNHSFYTVDSVRDLKNSVMIIQMGYLFIF